jgi:glyoxylase-like metal-dependent hydrolase (beta-lactamase superfamily II)
MLDIVQMPLGAYQTNCYLVARSGASEAVVIDPGDEPEHVLAELDARGWKPAAVLVTHGHFDHLGAVKGVAEAAGAEVWMPRGEADDLRTFDGAAYEPEHLLDGGELVAAGGIEFETMLVPGHSPAPIAYHADGHLFAGDVLFAGSVGRTDLAGGDMDVLVASIARLMDAYPAETVVLPGHGPVTTLGRERAANPFLEALRA